LVEIAAALMAHYRIGELNFGRRVATDRFARKHWIFANERGRMNLPTNSTWSQALSSAIFQFVILRALRKSGWSRSSSYHRRGGSPLPSSQCLALVVTGLHLVEPVALGAKVIDFVEHPVKQRFG